MTARTEAWESQARGHEAEAILFRVLGDRDTERMHLLAARALAEEARFERALTTSRAATPDEIRHTSHVHFQPDCPWCFASLDPA